MSYASDRERTEGKLTKEKLQKVMDKLVVPYLATGDTSAAVQTMDDTGDIHGMAIASVLGRNGRPADVGWDVYLLQEGPKCPVLRQVLTNSWLVRFAHRDGKDLPRGEVFRASLAGLKEDEAFLRSLDLPGIMPVDPAKELATWDAVRTHCMDTLATFAMR